MAEPCTALALSIGRTVVLAPRDAQAVYLQVATASRQPALADQLKRPDDRQKAKEWMRDIAWQVEHGRDMRTRQRWMVAHMLIEEALRRGTKQPIPLDRVPTGRTR